MKDVNKYRTVLIITFFFAPSTLVGGKRFSFLSYHFKKKINDIHILTSKIQNSDDKDKTIPFGGKIHFANMLPKYTVKNSNLKRSILTKIWVRYLCVIDPWSGWIIPAICKGIKIIKKNKIDVIICTGPPFSVFVVGLFLQIMTNNKLIYDYRDPWSNQKREFFKGYIPKINRILEKHCAKKANAIVFCTNMMMENFINYFGETFRKKCYVFTNGFEPNLYKGIQKLVGRKKIIYSGRLYGSRRIKLFTEPIKRLINENVIGHKNLRFHIFGNINNDDRKEIKENSLNDIFIEHALVNHKELLSYLGSADILVLIISENMRYSISYKFFDYLGTKRPILAVVPKNSEMKKIIEEIKCGRYAYLDSEESIYKNLRILIENKEKYKQNDVERFHWSSISEKYINLINEISK